MKTFMVVPRILAILLLVLAGCSKDSSGPTDTGGSVALSVTEVGSFIPSGVGSIGPYTVDVAVSGNYAYLANSFTNVAQSSWGLYVVDISNPAQPKQAAFVPLNFVNAVYVSGNYLYLAASNGVRIFDISNPASPSGMGAYASLNGVDIHVAGNYAYVIDATKGLTVLNVANKTTPTLAGSFAAKSSNPHGIYVDGTYAYFADGDSGMVVLNVASPASISEVGRYRVTVKDLGWAQHVQVVGDRAYLVGLLGMMALDISNKAKPTSLGFYDPPGPGMQLDVQGSLAYVANQNDGVRVVDITNPSAMKEVGSYVTPGLAQGVIAVGNLIYVADDDGGLRILKVQ
jgi:hypothetical protein